MAWRESGDDWVRDDGVIVKQDVGHLSNFRVVSPHGTAMMIAHPYKGSSTVQRFKTAKGARETADRKWPLKTPENA